ncbi:MAG: hypothetical protein AUK44_02680 [Porphyromonadaceae bacterium CG2_30_38_12]|nr:MAG: hypothetical protein AUK44_02680 [Porphyromonadaceae bacterium CG2_30_38_12]
MNINKNLQIRKKSNSVFYSKNSGFANHDIVRSGLQMKNNEQTNILTAIISENRLLSQPIYIKY